MKDATLKDSRRQKRLIDRVLFHLSPRTVSIHLFRLNNNTGVRAGQLDSLQIWLIMSKKLT